MKKIPSDAKLIEAIREANAVIDTLASADCVEMHWYVGKDEVVLFKNFKNDEFRIWVNINRDSFTFSKDGCAICNTSNNIDAWYSSDPATLSRKLTNIVKLGFNNTLIDSIKVKTDNQGDYLQVTYKKSLVGFPGKSTTNIHSSSDDWYVLAHNED